LIVSATSTSRWNADIHASFSRMGTRRTSKRSSKLGYNASLAGMLYQSISHIKKALFCLCQDLQSLYSSKAEIRNLLILYITNTIALVSLYNSYLPAPVKVAWVIVTSYYRRAFVVDDASSKNQAAFR
jgi:hypothetical protein